MNKYLFLESHEGDPSKSCFIVEALTKEDAAKKVAKSLIRTEEIFIGHVSDRCINMCFAEKFWIQTEQDYRIFESNCEANIDENEFKNRVKTYFSANPKLADEYIYYYFSEIPYELLSDELLIDIWIRDWDKFNITDINEIKILK